MKKLILLGLSLIVAFTSLMAQQRRPIDNEHPLWLVHIDVWNKADPQKIIDLIPDEVKPYVCMNLSLSCQYDKDKNLYKMPQQAVRTYKSWATVCQHNGLWFTCQPASGGHTHIQDDDLETFEYFFRRYPNFLGWNYAEQFWGFDEAGDKSSSTQASRWALFAKLVKMSHEYGGFLTISFCGNIWSHPLNPIGEMKRDKDFFEACQQYPEAILWLYKYTTSSCFYNNESVSFGPFISGLAKNYGVRYDNCGWNGALDTVLGSNHGKKYPVAAGIGTVMEQTAMNGGAVWDGPELIWTEDFQNLSNTTVETYTQRNWGTFPGFRGAWLDMFRKVIDGTMYIPSREEVVEKTKIVVINNITSGTDEQRYAAWGNLYDGLYKQTDPFNRGNGQWMDNLCYFKSTGRYGTIPVVMGLYDDVASSIPVQVKKSNYSSRWPSQARKQADFNAQYPLVSTGDLYVQRFRNQLVTYTPYSYLNAKTTASAAIPLQYNTCDTLHLLYGKLSSGLIREYADHIDFYLNNYRNDTTTQQLDQIVLSGVGSEPSYTLTKRTQATASATAAYDAADSTYTLSVKHNGPVDIRLDCSGSASRDADLPTVREAVALPIPQQPDAYHGAIIIEAEDMDYKNIQSCVLDPFYAYPAVIGHSGNGFVDLGTSTSGALRHKLSLKEEGNYVISVRYTSDKRKGRLTAAVNGQRQMVACDQTGVNEWRKVSFEASLRSGSNTLVLTNTGATAMYIDQIIYTPADTEAERFLVTVRPADHGTVTPSVDEAAEGDTVSLRVEPEAGYALTELRLVNSIFYTLASTIDISDASGDITFAMPDDNVTIQPVFTDVTSVLKLDFSAVQGGAMPAGWRCVQESNDVHEYPNTFSQGARTLVGFTGYQGKGLYWREECAEFGRQSAFPLTLSAGSYKLTFAMAAWKGTPKYQVSLLHASTGEAVAQSETYTASPNANGNTTANLTSAVQRELPVTITEPGNYVVSFTNQSRSAGFDEYLLLECRLNSVLHDGIAQPALADAAPSAWDLQGRRLSASQAATQRGVVIMRSADGTVHKVIRKR